jgi:hypothetical protein
MRLDVERGEDEELLGAQRVGARRTHFGRELREEARALGFTDVVMPLGLTEDSNKKRISLVGLFSTAKFLSRVGPHDKAKPALDSFKSQKTVKVYSSEKGAYTYVNLEDSGAGATTA